MSKLYGLIPAAGKGTRARPYTSKLPKSMLKIGGTPNLQRNIELMRDQLSIRDIVIITGYHAEIIESFLGNGRQLGVHLHYVRNTELERGLAWSILLGRQIIDDYFCVILSDECYVESNHHELKNYPFRKAIATCGIKEVDDKELIRRNYAVRFQGQCIAELIEKPDHIDNDILGCGTFVFSPEIFLLLAKAFEKAADDYVEFISFLNELCLQAKTIFPFWLKGSYVNINDRDSFALAQFHDRNHLFASRSKSLFIYSEGTEENVGFTIARYSKIFSPEDIYLIVPADNFIEHIAIKYGIKLVRCPSDCVLYGQKIKYAFDLADADILILTEADYAFPARDVEKLFAYLKEADMVIGTRTSRQLMERGTDIQGIVRLANVFVAKLLEVLWWHFEGRFTDVGCTFRAIWQTSYLAIQDNLRFKGPEFSAEMMVEILNQRMRVLEVPVNYNNVSRALNKKYRNVNTFFRFLQMLLSKRLS